MKKSCTTTAALCALSMSVCQSWAPPVSHLPVSHRRPRVVFPSIQMVGAKRNSSSKTKYSNKPSGVGPKQSSSTKLEAISYENDPEYFQEDVRDSYNPKVGDEVQVEIISFGPMGASIDVVAKSHDPKDVLNVDEEPYARGIVFQNEIQYFRQRRDNLDVVLGEVLKGYVSKVREDGKLDIALRKLGRGKVLDWGPIIYQRIREQPDGVLPLGDKSPPDDISREFPGISKKAFKQAISALYKRRLVQPGPNYVRMVEEEE